MKEAQEIQQVVAALKSDWSRARARRQQLEREGKQMSQNLEQLQVRRRRTFGGGAGQAW